MVRRSLASVVAYDRLLLHQYPLRASMLLAGDRSASALVHARLAQHLVYLRFRPAQAVVNDAHAGSASL